MNTCISKLSIDERVKYDSVTVALLLHAVYSLYTATQHLYTYIHLKLQQEIFF